MTEHPLTIAEREWMAEARENVPGDHARLRRFGLLNQVCSDEWRTVAGRVLIRAERLKKIRIAQQIAWN